MSKKLLLIQKSLIYALSLIEYELDISETDTLDDAVNNAVYDTEQKRHYYRTYFRYFQKICTEINRVKGKILNNVIGIDRN